MGTLVRFPLRWALLLVFSRVHAPPCCLCPPRPRGPGWAPLLGTRLLPKGWGCGPEPGRELQPSSFLALAGQFGRDLGGLKMMNIYTPFAWGTEIHPISETGKNLVFKKWLPDRARLSQAWGGGGHLLPAALLLRPIEVALASSCSCDQGLHGGFLPWDLGFTLRW